MSRGKTYWTQIHRQRQQYNSDTEWQKNEVLAVTTNMNTTVERAPEHYHYKEHLSSLFLNTFTVGAATTSSGKLFQKLTTRFEKIICLVVVENFSLYSFRGC